MRSLGAAHDVRTLLDAGTDEPWPNSREHARDVGLEGNYRPPNPFFAS